MVAFVQIVKTTAANRNSSEGEITATDEFLQDKLNSNSLSYIKVEIYDYSFYSQVSEFE